MQVFVVLLRGIVCKGHPVHPYLGNRHFMKLIYGGSRLAYLVANNHIRRDPKAFCPIFNRFPTVAI